MHLHCKECMQETLLPLFFIFHSGHSLNGSGDSLNNVQSIR